MAEAPTRVLGPGVALTQMQSCLPSDLRLRVRANQLPKKEVAEGVGGSSMNSNNGEYVFSKLDFSIEVGIL